MQNRIYLSPPHMGGGELKYIRLAFEENWIAPLGPNVNNIEKDICEFSGVKYAAALSSGTAAIHLALILLGVERQDEVLCQSLTFSASVNPVVYQHAVPVLIGSESATWNMCPETLEEAIKDRMAKGRKPKAIILVHLYGQPAKLDEIMAVSGKYGIPVIEDAAEALGAEYSSSSSSSSLVPRPLPPPSGSSSSPITQSPNHPITKYMKVGAFGKIGIFSFNGNKIITTSGGGALVSEDEALVKKAGYLATQACEDVPHYQHLAIGYNYRMSNICAGIGRGQMEVLPERIKQRRANYQYYYNALKNVDAISFLSEMDGTFSTRWLTCILIDKQLSGGVTPENIRLALEKENIEARPLWKPMHLQPIFSKYPYYGGDLSEKIFEKGLCLPSGSALSKHDRDRVIEIIKSLF
ncbi:MAG: DegT/DnrJ/EryC1/StrS family aminotransferase [Bacteroidetes bacterium]|nr:DegT/DnrJ/EryC1/StrS family aminotransferase [Bacteroidota bacterium]